MSETPEWNTLITSREAYFHLLCPLVPQSWRTSLNSMDTKGPFSLGTFLTGTIINGYLSHWVPFSLGTYPQVDSSSLLSLCCLHFKADYLQALAFALDTCTGHPICISESYLVDEKVFSPSVFLVSLPPGPTWVQPLKLLYKEMGNWPAVEDENITQDFQSYLGSPTGSRGLLSLQDKSQPFSSQMLDWPLNRTGGYPWAAPHSQSNADWLHGGQAFPRVPGSVSYSLYFTSRGGGQELSSELYEEGHVQLKFPSFFCESVHLKYINTETPSLKEYNLGLLFDCQEEEGKPECWLFKWGCQEFLKPLLWNLESSFEIKQQNQETPAPPGIGFSWALGPNRQEKIGLQSWAREPAHELNTKELLHNP